MIDLLPYHQMNTPPLSLILPLSLFLQDCKSTSPCAPTRCTNNSGRRRKEPARIPMPGWSKFNEYAKMRNANYQWEPTYPEDRVRVRRIGSVVGLSSHNIPGSFFSAAIVIVIHMYHITRLSYQLSEINEISEQLILFISATLCTV